MTEECWIFAGATNNYGYGKISHNRTTYGAHRVMYENLHGEVPRGLVLDHLCREPQCVNPDHLEPVTSAENVMRGVGIGVVHASQTHCKRGHEFTAENTYRVPPHKGLPNGGRSCRTCSNMRDRGYRKVKREMKGILV